jgi:DNA polymerase elongation subunit (family B)
MRTLEELQKSQNSILTLHYACTDIKKSPVIITSISVKNYATGQTDSFSFDEYGNEKDLLSAFVKCMKDYQNYTIVTWNQKSSTYGIQHIQRRCKESNIDDFPIKMEQVVDLDDIYTEKYGRNYVKNPKLRCLAELNKILS